MTLGSRLISLSLCPLIYKMGTTMPATKGGLNDLEHIKHLAQRQAHLDLMHDRCQL